MQSEIVISGAGFGAFLAAIALKRAGANVVVVSNTEIEKFTVDGRVFAISANSKAYLEEIGIWKCLEHEVSPIDDIVVADEESRLHYDSDLIGESLGYTVSAARLLDFMKEIIGEVKVGVITKLSCSNANISIELEGESVLKSQLLICAEGKHSRLRGLAGITSFEHKYNQEILTFVIDHELDHESLAFERFFDNGPFAVLPISGGYKSSVIFTDSPEKVEYFLVRKSELENEVKIRMNSYLGDISINGDIFQHNLSLIVPNRLYKNRVVLVADSAHGMHPIAGQGFNLGIRDIQCLADLVYEYKSYGLDVGSNSLLKKYSCQRMVDIGVMVCATDAIVRIFSCKSSITKSIRQKALSIVDSSNILKKSIMRYAMGYVNDYL